jgi:aldehyde:ferredoxin oxidoreductase
VLPEFDTMLAEHYRVRGWTPEGVPSAARLEALGLA